MQLLQFRLLEKCPLEDFVLFLHSFEILAIGDNNDGTFNGAADEPDEFKWVKEIDPIILTGFSIHHQASLASISQHLFATVANYLDGSLKLCQGKERGRSLLI